MEFYRIWRIAVGYKWLLIWFPIATALIGLGVTYVLPQIYESSALVLVRPIQDIKFSQGGSGKNEALDLPVVLSAPIDAPSKTYIEVIKSEAVARKIVEALHLDVKEPKQYDSWFEEVKDDLKTWASDTMRTIRNYAQYGRDIPTTPFDRAVADVEKSLVVTPRKDTYVFDITYKSGSPDQAAAVANMAAEIFLQQSAEAYRSESARAREFIEKQLNESRMALEQARATTLAFKDQGSTFDLKGEYTEKLKDVSDLQNMLAKNEGKLAGLQRTSLSGSPNLTAQQAEISELKSQITNLQQQLAKYPSTEAKLNSILLAEHLAEENYEFFIKEYADARVKEAATVAEIRIVSKAEPSLYPTKPLKYVYAGLSYGTALILAFGWALFIEALDPRVRTINDIDDEFDVPLLGAIPTFRIN